MADQIRWQARMNSYQRVEDLEMIGIKPPVEDPNTASDMYCFDNPHNSEKMNLMKSCVRSEAKQLVGDPGTL